MESLSFAHRAAISAGVMASSCVSGSSSPAMSSSVAAVAAPRLSRFHEKREMRMTFFAAARSRFIMAEPPLAPNMDAFSAFFFFGSLACTTLMPCSKMTTKAFKLYT